MTAPAPRRIALHVDVGPALRASLDAAAAASGRSPSQYTRELLTRSLAQHGSPADGGAHPPRPQGIEAPRAGAPADRGAGDPSSPKVARRIELDPELCAQLDAYAARGSFRSRPAAIRFMLEAATQYPAQANGKPDRVAEVANTNSALAHHPKPSDRGALVGQALPALDPAWLKDATVALARSNATLLPIGNNLNQIARSLHTMPGLLNADDLRAIEQARAQMRAHVELSARLVSSLQAYITPFRGK